MELGFRNENGFADALPAPPMLLKAFNWTQRHGFTVPLLLQVAPLTRRAGTVRVLAPLRDAMILRDVDQARFKG